ncbi:MAG: hypothetical protein AAF805_03070 [Planctomycetota bacterium]
MSQSLTPSPTADNHGVVTLPVVRLPECNRCGACCENGGDCELRPWLPSAATGERLPTEFSGRCEHLREQAAGVTVCDVINEATQAGTDKARERLGELLNGRCEWPVLRRRNWLDDASEGKGAEGGDLIAGELPRVETEPWPERNPDVTDLMPDDGWGE